MVINYYPCSCQSCTYFHPYVVAEPLFVVCTTIALKGKAYDPFSVLFPSTTFVVLGAPLKL